MPHRHLQCSLALADLDPVALRVTAFEVAESLSQTYRLRVDGVCADPIDPAKVLGKKATFSLVRGEETLRRWHGVTVAVAGEHAAKSGFRFSVEVVPRLEKLRLGRNTRMFQDQSAKKIVDKVLSEAGVPAGDVEWKLGAEPPKRLYTVQYSESDLDFVQRLLSEEGIGYALRNGDEEEKLVLFDDSTGLPDIEGAKTLLDRNSVDFEEDTLDQLREARVGASDVVMLRDYLFDKPSFDASSTKEAPKSTKREVYDHPGPFAGTPDGARRAERLLEALRVGVKTVRAESGNPRLEAGRVFEAQGARRQSLNAEYLLVQVSHEGRLGEGQFGEDGIGYRNQIFAIPKDVPFRPPVLPAPLPHGLEVAFVACPPGEELHSDKWGRVKVRFPWDRSGVTDDRASAWLRVGQPPMQGSMVLPRGKFEVMIDFERGLVDAPFVAGHLYNEEAAPPYALPDGKTRSSFQTATTHGGGGANELRFEDAAGSEEIFLNASKDYTVSVENDAKHSITQHKKTKVGSNSKLKVGDSADLEIVGGRQLDVGAAQDINVGKDFSDAVGGGSTLQVGAVRKRQVGGNLAENVKGTFDRTVGGLLAVTAIRGYCRNIVGGSQTLVGAAWLELIGRNRLSNVGGLRNEAIGGIKLVKAKQVAISSGLAYAETAATEVATTKGGWSDTAKGGIALSAAGGMSIKAKAVTFEAKQSLTLIAGTCTFKLSKSGEVEISAPNVDLRGVEALNQVNHKSN